MTISRRNVLQSAGASALLAAIGQQAFAQSTNLEVVRLITGFAAGGTSDTTCRRVATRLAPEYAKTAKQPLEDFTRESIANPTAYVEKGYQPTMPDFGQTLSAKQSSDLVAYLTQKG